MARLAPLVLLLAAVPLCLNWTLADMRPERIAQLCGPDVPFDFPPLASLDRMPNNLPVQLTTFIGRIGEATEDIEIVRTASGKRSATTAGK